MDAKKAVSTTLLKLFFNKKPTVFRSLSASDKKNFLQNFFFNKMFFLDTWNAVLTKLSEFFSTKCRKKFCSLADNDKESHFFQREHFSSQCSYGNVECDFENSIKFLNK